MVNYTKKKKMENGGVRGTLGHYKEKKDQIGKVAVHEEL